MGPSKAFNQSRPSPPAGQPRTAATAASPFFLPLALPVIGSTSLELDDFINSPKSVHRLFEHAVYHCQVTVYSLISACTISAAHLLCPGVIL